MGKQRRHRQFLHLSARLSGVFQQFPAAINLWLSILEVPPQYPLHIQKILYNIDARYKEILLTRPFAATNQTVPERQQGNTCRLRGSTEYLQTGFNEETPLSSSKDKKTKKMTEAELHKKGQEQ
ncbi:MAG: hypothetical protein GY945_12590 [Rhodobacteraceae bacterium]|nr:hypothetical protein [Paracoccaceae bacterium]